MPRKDQTAYREYMREYMRQRYHRKLAKRKQNQLSAVERARAEVTRVLERFDLTPKPTHI